MTFTTTTLVDNRVLVRGTDVLGTEGSVVLDSTQWNEINERTEIKQAQAEFDATVEAFFAPIEKAAAKLQQTFERPADSLSFIVISEEEKATPGKAAHVVRLSHDSMVLRLLEQGAGDRLVWVNDGLEILEADAQAPAVDDDAVIADAD